MEQVLYASRATTGVSPADVFKIIESSARNNPRRDVTGFLVFTGEEFLQLVEGPPAALDELLAVLARDPRHAGIDVLARMAIARRCFPSWKMQRFDLATGDARSVLATLRANRIGHGMLGAVEGFLTRSRKAA